MAASKAERLKAIFAELEIAGPFTDGFVARNALAEIMTRIEDNMSGVPKNPDAAFAPTDGRMYPPDDIFERPSKSAKMRIFKQVRHITYIGQNGALMITSGDEIVINKPGLDGKKIHDLFQEDET